MPAEPLTATVREAQPGDWSFLDHLQRKHHGAIGFLSRTALEHAIARGRVLLAMENGEPAGYLYGKAPYQRQEHVAIIFQAAINFDARRRMLGTALVEAFAGRFPERVSQLCLWCAADLDANLFWSALGFVPVATRAGARRTQRTHIFWCRRLNRLAGISGSPTAEDRCTPSTDLPSPLILGTSDRADPIPDTPTGFWVPASTCAGVMRESRTVTVLSPLR